MNVGILGSGLMGGKLGTMFARAGHTVVFSYSHEWDKLERLARRAGHGARAGTPHEAVADADAVLLAVHWTRLDDVLHQAGSLAGKIVLSCSLPMSRDDSRLVVGHTTSGAEQIAKKLPRATIVSAFSTSPSEAFYAVFARRKNVRRPSMVYCTNGAKARRIAATLIRDIGFDPIDAGPLENARFVEPYTMLLAHLAYEKPGGPALTYRLERYRERKSI